MHLVHSLFAGIGVSIVQKFTLYLWMLLCAVWLGFAPLAKRTTYKQPAHQRTKYILLIGGGLFLLFGSMEAMPIPDALNRPLFSVNLYVALMGFAVSFCGIAFSIWARFTLDNNWSGAASIKHDHTLTRNGPYRVTRHPIYTGFVVAFLGTAIERGLMRSFFAVALCTFGLWVKLQVEERFMLQRFGDEYIQYRRDVPALFPVRFKQPSLRN